MDDRFGLIEPTAGRVANGRSVGPDHVVLGEFVGTTPMTTRAPVRFPQVRHSLRRLEPATTSGIGGDSDQNGANSNRLRPACPQVSGGLSVGLTGFEPATP